MNVFVECNPDEVLVMTLGIARKSLTHSNDKGRVCNNLKSKYMKSIGVIDEDPNSAQPSYLSQLQLREELKPLIKILFDPKRENKLIILRPRLEEWLIKLAIDSRLSLKAYNLPDTPSDLHSELANRPQKMISLVKKLIELKNPAILFLKKHLQQH